MPYGSTQPIYVGRCDAYGGFFKSLECHREGACAFVRLSYLQPCALSLLPDDVDVVAVVDALTKMNSEK